MKFGIGFYLRAAIIVLVVGIVGFPAASLFFTYLFTAPAHKHIGSPPADFPFPMENVSFETSDNVLISGWYSPGERENQAIILLHGYRKNRLQALSRARLFRGHGYGVLLYDARACGESGGDRISVGYYERLDLLAAIRFLRQQDVRKIACVGISQGGATIFMAAPELSGIRCVVAESAYSNITDALDRRFRLYLKIPGDLGAALLLPFGEMLLNLKAEQLSPLKKSDQLHCPLLVISGTADRKTLPEDTRKLFRAANKPKQLWMVEGAKHEDLYKFSPGEYKKKVLEFINRYINTD